MRLTLIFENLRISWRAIRSNRVRAVLTMSIIAFGIMALVGILTAIDAIKGSITNQFSMMGANSFSITSRGMNIQIGNSSTRTRNYSRISFREAMAFKESFKEPAWVSVSYNATSLGTVKYGSEETNPNVSVSGIDENYISVGGYQIGRGRNITSDEVDNYRLVTIIGSDIARSLFPGDDDPVDKIVTIAGLRLRIIGVLETKGASALSSDNVCFIPVTTARNYFSRSNMTFSISVMPFSNENMEIMASQAEGQMRIIRNLAPTDESDFNITKSDNIVALLMENLKYVTLAATLIGIITLFGAAVGLMNIMLVSVTERTREIGVRMALGAKKASIKNQFLIESIIIGQLGGLIGILLGIGIGNLLALSLGTSFMIPWVWVLTGIFVCFVVGVMSGYFPAVRAAAIDPIEALRYE